jgi:osmotically-inducible protein OsmY
MNRGGEVINMSQRLYLRVQERPSYRGFGPQGYLRSDARILEDVSEELTEHERVDAREIDVQVGDGEVTLRGHVPDEDMKRLAEEATERLRGVRAVHNQLIIQPAQG